jgi:pyruvate,water dikinase
MRRDIEAASAEILDGLQGDALEQMRAANEVNLRMAPLTPDHHFYIDQGANAHVRLVLLAVGRKLVDAGRLERPDDVLFLKYNELRMLIGSADAIDAQALVAQRRAERDAARQVHPRDWVGTVTPSQLAFPYLVNWGYPERFHRQQSEDETRIEGIAGSPGTIEGTARVVMTTDEFDQVRDGDILVCQMTNPAWVVLFTKIAGLVTDTGGTTSHPAVLSREFGIPAVIGTSVATKRIKTGDRIRVDGTTGVVEVLSSGTPTGTTTSTPPETAAIGS